MRRIRGIAALAIVGSLAIHAGCNDCGDYSYRGYANDEWCGTTYGTYGEWWDGGEEDGGGTYVLHFEHDVPPGEFMFWHRGSVEAYVLVDEVNRGLTYTTNTPRVLCSWTDIHEPSDPNDDVVHTEEPATAFELTYLGKRMPLGMAPVRAFAWSITCGDGVFQLDGRDGIEMGNIDGVHPRYAELAATGMVAAPDTAE